jgi:protein SCO1/2
MKNMLLLAASSLFLLTACSPSEPKLPFMGEKKLVTRTENGKTITDSLPHTISDFEFTDQNGQLISQKNVSGKVYIADFFFTSCPTICPKVKKQMKRVYERFSGRTDFLMLSHSIDTRFDTVARLAWYGEKLGIKAPIWHLLTGDKDRLYKIAYDYLLTALEDKEAPGGFDHSGAIALIDKERRIRGLYDGLDEQKVDLMMQDIEKLLKE